MPNGEESHIARGIIAAKLTVTEGRKKRRRGLSSQRRIESLDFEIVRLSEHPAMPNSARKLIANKANDVIVSAASAWEIATKVRLGKLDLATEIVEDFPTYLENERFAELAVTARHGIRAGLLPGPHRDPFDRMLIAQALEENLRIISSEEVFDSYGVVRLW